MRLKSINTEILSFLSFISIEQRYSFEVFLNYTGIVVCEVPQWLTHEFFFFFYIYSWVVKFRVFFPLKASSQVFIVLFSLLSGTPAVFALRPLLQELTCSAMDILDEQRGGICPVAITVIELAKLSTTLRPHSVSTLVGLSPLSANPLEHASHPEGCMIPRGHRFGEHARPASLSGLPKMTVGPLGAPLGAQLVQSSASSPAPSGSSHAAAMMVMMGHIGPSTPNFAPNLHYDTTKMPPPPPKQRAYQPPQPPKPPWGGVTWVK